MQAVGVWILVSVVGPVPSRSVMDTTELVQPAGKPAFVILSLLGLIALIALIAFTALLRKGRGADKAAPKVKLDRLTQLADQDAFFAWEWSRGDFVGVVDIDHLTAINREHGRAAGDAVLAVAGSVFARAIDAGYIKAAWRIGGDRFAVAVTAMPANLAARMFNVLRNQIPLEVEKQLDRPSGRVTATCSMVRVRDCSIDEALMEAQVLLAMAKDEGRDRLTHRDDDFQISSDDCENRRNRSS